MSDAIKTAGPDTTIKLVIWRTDMKTQLDITPNGLDTVTGAELYIGTIAPFLAPGTRLTITHETVTTYEVKT